MTIKYEVLKRYRRNAVVPICMMSWDKYREGQIEELEHIVGNDIVSMKPPIRDYNNYSHGLCNYHYNMYFRLKELSK